MKSEKLMDYIGQIDDSIIVEADVHSIKIKPAKQSWLKWIPVVAVAATCLIISVSLILNRTQPTSHDDFTNLPILTANVEFGKNVEFGENIDFSANVEFGDMGFGGLMAYDVSELQSGNPWTENNDLVTMPAFTNPKEYDSKGTLINGLSAEEMLAEAEEIANLFDLEITSLYTDPTPEQIEEIRQKLERVDASEEDILRNTSANRATAECIGARVEIQEDGHIILALTPETAELVYDIGKLDAYNSFTVTFDYGSESANGTGPSTGLPLPDGYSFTFSNTSNEQAMEITQYLFSEYGAFSGITTPGYDLSADYTYEGELTRLHTTVFENSGSLTDRILNYHFNSLQFVATESGGLGDIRHYNTDLSQKIGDYPIITAEEARTLLLENNYYTSVPEELPGEEYIAHVELTYLTNSWDSIFMPYYMFLVEMPTMAQENGLKTFGIFYVPAIQGEFLEIAPSAARFN